MNLDLPGIQADAMPNFRFGGTNENFGAVIVAALPYIFFVAGLLLLIYIIIGGYSLMFSQGDPKSIAAAKAKITSGLIGFIIVFVAYWLVQAIGLILGLPDFQTIFG